MSKMDYPDLEPNWTSDRSWEDMVRRIEELESAIAKAVRHAEANGMGEWKVFVALRKLIR